MSIDVMYMSKTDDWATPQDFFNELDKEFNFDLDPCSDDNNAKCKRHFTKEDDGLSQNWGGAGSSVIRLMVQKYRNGLKRVFTKDTRTTRLSLC